MSYVTFQCRCYNIFKKILNFFCPQKVEKKPPEKVAYLWQLGVFLLYSPDCPKQPRTLFPFYKFFYPIISAKVSAFKRPCRILNEFNLFQPFPDETLNFGSLWWPGFWLSNFDRSQLWTVTFGSHQATYNDKSQVLN